MPLKTELQELTLSRANIFTTSEVCRAAIFAMLRTECYEVPRWVSFKGIVFTCSFTNVRKLEDLKNTSV